MAEAHKFSSLAKALDVFPELDWAQDADGNTYITNSKTGENASVSKGQHIVKIADRYEVHDEAPANAKTAEKPKAAAKSEPKAETAEQDNANSAGSVEPSNTVPPQYLGAPEGTAEAAGTPTAE